MGSKNQKMIFDAMTSRTLWSVSMDKAQRHLKLMQDAIAQIEFCLGRTTETAFKQDSCIQATANFWLIALGEAARHVAPQIRNNNPSLPWQNLIQSRNDLAHQKIFSSNEVWKFYQDRIPVLKKELESICASCETI